MATTSITIRMDEELKKQAEMLFDNIGMNMTTAFTVFVKAAVRQNKIPFELSAGAFDHVAGNAGLCCRIDESLEDEKANRTRAIVKR